MCPHIAAYLCASIDIQTCIEICVDEQSFRYNATVYVQDQSKASLA